MREIVKSLIRRLGKNEDVPGDSVLNSKADPSLASATTAAGLADALLSSSGTSLNGRANDTKQELCMSGALDPSEAIATTPSGSSETTTSNKPQPKLPTAAPQTGAQGSLAAEDPSGTNGALSPVSESTTLAVSRHCPPVLRRSTWNVTDFDLRALLYNGNISMVYHAIDKRSGITVALKLYKRAKLTAIERHQVAREIKLHINLNHASIIAMYAAWKDKQYVYLALEWAPGGDVYSYLRSNGQRLTEDLAVHLIMEPFLEGLLLLHTQGLIHRDIKPENILLTRALQVKIADFGLSIDSKHEIANTRLGTVDYLAPEILECPIKHSPHDNKDNPRIGYTNKVDCWSVGVLAYELLTGQPPFAAGTPQETLRNIRSKPIEWPPWLSKESLDFMRLALVRDPTRRLSISQMLEHPWIRRYSRHSRPAAPHASGVSDMVSRRNSVPASLISTSLRSMALETNGMSFDSITPTAAPFGNQPMIGMPSGAVHAAAAKSHIGFPHTVQQPVVPSRPVGPVGHMGATSENGVQQAVLYSTVSGHEMRLQMASRSFAGNSLAPHTHASPLLAPAAPVVKGPSPEYHSAATSVSPGNQADQQWQQVSSDAPLTHVQPTSEAPGHLNAQGRIVKFLSLGPSHHSHSHSIAGSVVARVGPITEHTATPTSYSPAPQDGMPQEPPATSVKQPMPASRKPEGLIVATCNTSNGTSTPHSPTSAGKANRGECSSPTNKSHNGGTTSSTAGQVHLPPIDLHRSLTRDHAN